MLFLIFYTQKVKANQEENTFLKINKPQYHLLLSQNDPEKKEEKPPEINQEEYNLSKALIYESSGGLAGMVLGTSLGIGIAILTKKDCSSSTDDECYFTTGMQTLGAAMLLGSFGFFFGTALGIDIGGNLYQKNNNTSFTGSVGYTLLGTLSGILVSIPLFYLKPGSLVGFSSLVLLSGAGGILGYELSKEKKEAPQKESLKDLQDKYSLKIIPLYKGIGLSLALH